MVSLFLSGCNHILLMAGSFTLATSLLSIKYVLYANEYNIIL